MELSLFLAQLFGLTMIIFILTSLFRPTIVDNIIQELKSKSLAVFITSFISVMGGLAVVLSHNIWEMNWRGLVTFFGWAALIKGIGIIAFPEIMLKTANKIMKGNARVTWLTVSLVVSCYLVYSGFGMGI